MLDWRWKTWTLHYRFSAITELPVRLSVLWGGFRSFFWKLYCILLMYRKYQHFPLHLSLSMTCHKEIPLLLSQQWKNEKKCQMHTQWAIEREYFFLICQYFVVISLKAGNSIDEPVTNRIYFMVPWNPNDTPSGIIHPTPKPSIPALQVVSCTVVYHPPPQRSHS